MKKVIIEKVELEAPEPNNELKILEDLARKTFKINSLILIKDSFGRYNLKDIKTNKIFLSSFNIRDVYNFLNKK